MSFLTLEDYPANETNKISEKIIHYKYDPLALTIHLRRTGQIGPSIYDELMVETTNDIIPVGAHTEAELMRRFFRNRIMMRRLKGQFISKYMCVLEDILDNDARSFPESHAKIIVTLPGFYHETLETESLYQNYKSLLNEIGTFDVNGNFTFVKSVSRNARAGSFTTHYFETDTHNLLGVRVNISDTGSAAWSYILQNEPSIHIKGIAVNTAYRGYDFRFYQLSPGYILSKAR